MKYRVEIDISFDTEAEALALKEYIRSVRAKIYSPSGKEPIEVFRKCKKAEDSFDGSDQLNMTEVDFTV